MRLYGVKSPAELTKEKKSEFFTSIKKDWAKIKIEIKQKKSTSIKTHAQESNQKISEKTSQENDLPYKKPTDATTQSRYSRPKKCQGEPEYQLTKHIIKSKPNEEQTDYLKILYTPNFHFGQEIDYNYPVVKMPKSNSSLKLPRIGRSNQKGYKENDFYNEIQDQMSDIELTNNVHLVIPNYNKPYEPDIVLFDKRLNLYIDIEIDEPYDGYFRYPTHCIRDEEDQKQDDIRDLFFTESGWIVIRFTEKQVHLQSSECIKYQY